MHMEVLPAWLDSVGMLLILELDRNRNQSPVAHAALGNDTPGEVPHIARRTFQNRDLQTLSWSRCTCVVATDRS